jgi:hypothetical protein
MEMHFRAVPHVFIQEIHARTLPKDQAVKTASKLDPYITSEDVPGLTAQGVPRQPGRSNHWDSSADKKVTHRQPSLIRRGKEPLALLVYGAPPWRNNVPVLAPFPSREQSRFSGCSQSTHQAVPYSIY